MCSIVGVPALEWRPAALQTAPQSDAAEKNPVEWYLHSRKLHSREYDDCSALPKAPELHDKLSASDAMQFPSVPISISVSVLAEHQYQIQGLPYDPQQ